MDMTYIAVAAAAVLIAAGGFLLLRRGRKPDGAENEPDTPSESSPEQTDSAGPDGPYDEALYNLGMNPVLDKPLMYALTTCQHCKNTRKFLDENSVDYTIIYLDTFPKQQRSDLMEKVRTYNPRGTFPTILVPGGKVIIGYRRQLLKEAFLNDTGTAA